MTQRSVPIVYEGGPTLAPTVIGALVAQATLADVMAWGRSLQPPRSPLEIITQDEYTHDVVLALGPDTYLVYDTT